MDAKAMLERFEVLAEAPGGVARVRQLVLELAVRGRLVAQEAGDEPASVLLARIAKERARLVAEKKIPKSEPLPPVGEGERPYALPEGWAWVRVGAIVQQRLGKMLDNAKNRGELRPYLRNVNVRWFGFDLTDLLSMRIEEDEVEELALVSGDLLICEGGEPGRAAVWREAVKPMYFQKAIHRVRMFGGILPELLALVLRHDALTGLLAAHCTGATIKHFTGQSLCSYPFPLPPLAEQRRIVAQVDALMAWCDQLQQRFADRDGRREGMREVVLGKIAQAPVAEARAMWTRAAASWPALVQRAEDVPTLRRAVLELAVRGRLVAQEAGDEPASALLARIAKERARLVAEKKIAKAELLPPVAEGERPYEVPEGWAWARLGTLLAFGPMNGLSPPKSNAAEGVLSLTLSATTKGVFDEQHTKPVAIEVPVDSALWLAPGDILVQRGNSLEHVGIAAVYRGATARFIFPDLMVKLRLIDSMDTNFVHLMLVSPSGRAYFRSRASGTSSSMPKINHDAIRNAPIPVPPLAEQRRIVAQVDALMALCDRLEASLRAQRAGHEAVAAAFARALAGASSAA